jgi:hypothetical protein
MTTQEEKELADIAEAAIKAAERERDGGGAHMPKALPLTKRNAGTFKDKRTPDALPTMAHRSDATTPDIARVKPGARGKFYRHPSRGLVRPARFDDPIEDTFDV